MPLRVQYFQIAEFFKVIDDDNLWTVESEKQMVQIREWALCMQFFFLYEENNEKKKLIRKKQKAKILFLIIPFSPSLRGSFCCL